MKEIFDLPSKFIYPFKQSYDEYKHEGLNLFLEKMYKVALKEGYLDFKDPLLAFNTAYYIASAIFLTPRVDFRVFKVEVDLALLHHLGFYKPRDVPFPPDLEIPNTHCCIHNELIVRLMVYAILFLLNDKTVEMAEYLDGYRLRLEDMISDYEDDAIEGIAFGYDVLALIKSCPDRYDIDLYPNIKVAQLQDADWSLGLRYYAEDDILRLMTFFRTKEEQHAFLDWMDDMNMMYGDESDV